eukprot:TRINITY_DN20492_c0_g1_i1.p1 TRINITY_DN20492_c0_g1~~TRINITY_DN20492_c0_g1_i1.p1  ORF type:complete len:723 (+),score=146.95 TRINITY_DN20492_c0_g1_i1:87-2255(+)
MVSDHFADAVEHAVFEDAEDLQSRAGLPLCQVLNGFVTAECGTSGDESTRSPRTDGAPEAVRFSDLGSGAEPSFEEYLSADEGEAVCEVAPERTTSRLENGQVERTRPVSSAAVGTQSTSPASSSGQVAPNSQKLSNTGGYGMGLYKGCVVNVVGGKYKGATGTVERCTPVKVHIELHSGDKVCINQSSVQPQSDSQSPQSLQPAAQQDGAVTRSSAAAADAEQRVLPGSAGGRASGTAASERTPSRVEDAPDFGHHLRSSDAVGIRSTSPAHSPGQVASNPQKLPDAGRQGMGLYNGSVVNVVGGKYKGATATVDRCTPLKVHLKLHSGGEVCISQSSVQPQSASQSPQNLQSAATQDAGTRSTTASAAAERGSLVANSVKAAAGREPAAAGSLGLDEARSESERPPVAARRPEHLVEGDVDEQSEYASADEGESTDEDMPVCGGHASGQTQEPRENDRPASRNGHFTSSAGTRSSAELCEGDQVLVKSGKHKKKVGRVERLTAKMVALKTASGEELRILQTSVARLCDTGLDDDGAGSDEQGYRQLPPPPSFQLTGAATLHGGMAEEKVVLRPVHKPKAERCFFDEWFGGRARLYEVPLKTLAQTQLPEARFEEDGKTWELVSAKVHDDGVAFFGVRKACYRMVYIMTRGPGVEDIDLRGKLEDKSFNLGLRLGGADVRAEGNAGADVEVLFFLSFRFAGCSMLHRAFLRLDDDPLRPTS